jgi:hypothetical protein
MLHLGSMLDAPQGLMVTASLQLLLQLGGMPAPISARLLIDSMPASAAYDTRRHAGWHLGGMIALLRHACRCSN